eukprot:486930-Pleurochrysis_carterae.AAC.2
MMLWAGVWAWCVRVRTDARMCVGAVCSWARAWFRVSVGARWCTTTRRARAKVGRKDEERDDESSCARNSSMIVIVGVRARCGTAATLARGRGCHAGARRSFRRRQGAAAGACASARPRWRSRCAASRCSRRPCESASQPPDQTVAYACVSAVWVPRPAHERLHASLAMLSERKDVCMCISQPARVHVQLLVLVHVHLSASGWMRVQVTRALRVLLA